MADIILYKNTENSLIFFVNLSTNLGELEAICPVQYLGFVLSSVFRLICTLISISEFKNTGIKILLLALYSILLFK